MSNELDLAIGDTIQLDGGMALVESVGSKTADAIMLDSKHKGKVRTVNTPFSRHLIIERGGQAALDKFNNDAKEKDKSRKGFIQTEPGDVLCHGGEIRTVVSVTDKWCTIGSLDGEEFAEPRWLNEFFFRDCTCHQLVRLDADARAANLKQFLAQRKSPLVEDQTSDEAVTTETEMKTKSKTSSAATRNVSTKGKRTTKPKAAKPAAAKSKRAAEQIADGKSSVAKNKLFGASLCRVAMTAGAAGISYEKFVEVMQKYGLSLSEGTIRQNMRIGKAGTMVGAVLTKEQLAEFGA